MTFTLINSPNNSNKRFFFKKKYLLIILFEILFGLNLMGQKIDPNGYNVFYYSNGVKSSEGYFKNGLPDSLWKTYNIEGVLSATGFKKEGLSTGVWKFYNKDGKLKQTSIYENDFKNGCTIIYDSLEIKAEERFYINDTLQQELIYYNQAGNIVRIDQLKDGMVNGDTKIFNEQGEVINEAYYEDGKLVANKKINEINEAGERVGFWRTYYPNGILQTEANYKNGKLHGLYKTYDKKGSLLAINYMINDSISDNSRDIVLIELYRTYFPNSMKEKLVGGLTNGMKNGLFREFDIEGNLVNGYLYKNDTLKAEGLILNDGTYDGDWKYYYPDGKVSIEGKYVAGKKSGMWIYYYNNGKIQQKGRYSDGEFDGAWVLYYPSGAIQAQEFYKRGKHEGTLVEFAENGEELTRGEYYNGLREGEWFYHVGDFKETGAYTLGMKNGVWKHYYQNGKLSFIGEYDEDQPKGKHLTYYETGVVKTKGKYKAGQKHGKWLTYNEMGETIENLEFYYGKLIKINGERIIEIEEELE